MSVYNVTAKRTTLLKSIGWDDGDLEDIVSDLIRKEFGGLSVLVLNDMTDQHFKGGQRLPKVGPLDKASVLSRRLQVAFPNYPIRGALPVKGAKSDGDKSKLSSGGGLYLFAAVPMSEPVIRTVDSVRKSLSPVAGFSLLPIESSDMVKKLSDTISRRSGRKSQWSVFIGQHKGGALRQVIVRDGQLAMTRMTPIADKGVDAQSWAEEVLQEFKATISYLSRFGYAQDDGTEVIVIAEKEAGKALEEKIDVVCNYTSMTVSEAATMLGMKIGKQESEGYADPLHVGWAGVKKRFILPLEAPDLQRIHKPRQIATFVIFLLLLGFGGGGWQLMNDVQALFSMKDDLGTQKNIQSKAQQELQGEVDRMNRLGYDVKLIGSSLDTFSQLETEEMKVLPIVKAIGEALGPAMRLDMLKVDYISNEPVVDEYGYGSYGGEQEASLPQLKAALHLSFPPSLDPEKAFTEVKDLEQRLTSILPEHKISVEKQVAERVYTGGVSGQSSTAEEAARTEEYTAQINVEGPAQ